MTQAGQNYLAHVRTNATWGGEPEADAIARAHNFTTHIFSLEDGVLSLVSTVGNGPAKNFSLCWNGTHYDVLNGGAALDNTALAPGMIAHNSTGDGNCMYESLMYILREGGGNIGRRLQDESNRAAYVSNMRNVAATNLSPALANILGDELPEVGDDEFMLELGSSWTDLGEHASAIYAAFPPKTYYLAYDDKKKDYVFTDRIAKTKGQYLSTYLEKTRGVKVRKEREKIGKLILRDKSYWTEEAIAKAAKEPDEIEYPCPSIVPATLYRWVSNDAAKDALKNGIKKVGGIHDGIPTMPNSITKEYAKAGGGVGIVVADKCLTITTSKIPQVNARQPNSIRKTVAKNGVEWKILVDIPAAAIR